jgi:peptidyl-prolyl cis-trans isomerase SurA
MRTFLSIQKTALRGAASVVLMAVAVASPGHAQSTDASSKVLDRVVAVVNNRAILWSDVADELRFAILDPNRTIGDTLTPRMALQQLISRALIQEQIRQEGAEALQPTNEVVQTRLAEIRHELPACVRQNCASDAGWAVFLATNDLTPEAVEAYLRLRLEILDFIETRFRQGIHISPQDTENYYRRTLLPQYAKGEPIPTLEAVAPRIEEILLQQQVNVMFDNWLENLRKQGDVEVLDPALESPAVPSGGGAGIQ